MYFPTVIHSFLRPQMRLVEPNPRLADFDFKAGTRVRISLLNILKNRLKGIFPIKFDNILNIAKYTTTTLLNIHLKQQVIENKKNK